MSSKPSSLRFGIVADPQYAAIEPDTLRDRYHARSLQKLEAAIATFNETDLDFVMTLGDVIDRDWRSFDDILPVYEASRHQTRFLLGNHDFAIATQHLASVAERLGMPGRYYDFVRSGWRFVVLDGNDISVFSSPPGDTRHALATDRLKALQTAGALNAQPWNGSLSEAQIAWLTDILEKAEREGEKVLVLGHYPIFPENSHNMWDSARLVALLTRYACFKAYFCGHNHAGNIGHVDGRPFITFRGMVDTADTTAYAIVTLGEDAIEIEGFGREESRRLALAEAALA